MSAEGSGGDDAPEPDDDAERTSARPARPTLGPPERAALLRQHAGAASTRAPAARVGDRCRLRGRRGASPPSSCWSRSARSAGATARRCHRRSSPPPVTSSTTPSPSGSAPRSRRAWSWSVRAGDDGARTVGSGVVVGSDRVVTAAHLLDDATDMVVVTTGGDQLPVQARRHRPADRPRAPVGAGRRPPALAARPLDAAARRADRRRGDRRARGALPRGHRRRVRSRRDGRRRHRRRRGRPARDGHLGAPRDVGRCAGRLRRQPRRRPHPIRHRERPTASRSRWPGCATCDDQLDGSGKVTHGWMGVVCDEDPAERRPARAARSCRPCSPESPAAKAGLAPGDVVVRAGGGS